MLLLQTLASHLRLAGCVVTASQVTTSHGIFVAQLLHLPWHFAMLVSGASCFEILKTAQQHSTPPQERLASANAFLSPVGHDIGISTQFPIQLATNSIIVGQII